MKKCAILKKVKKNSNPVAKAMLLSREVNTSPKVVQSKKRYDRKKFKNVSRKDKEFI